MPSPLRSRCSICDHHDQQGNKGRVNNNHSEAEARQKPDMTLPGFFHLFPLKPSHDPTTMLRVGSALWHLIQLAGRIF